MILLVPSCVSESNTIERITLVAPFQLHYHIALAKIHTALGCDSVSHKPELSYRMSTSSTRSDPIALNKLQHWDGLLEDVRALDKKKKAALSIKIIVSDHVCLATKILVPEFSYPLSTSNHFVHISAKKRPQQLERGRKRTLL